MYSRELFLVKLLDRNCSAELCHPVALILCSYNVNQIFMEKREEVIKC